VDPARLAYPSPLIIPKTNSSEEVDVALRKIGVEKVAIRLGLKDHDNISLKK
jgi:hypothetical protein